MPSKTSTKPTWDSSKEDRLGRPIAKKSASGKTSTSTRSKANSKSKIKEVKVTKGKETSAPAAARFSMKQMGEKKISLLTSENPKREGTRAFKSFSKYESGMTVAEFVKNGGTLADLKYDTKHGYVAID